jgi:serine/threonine protein kinase
MLQEISQYQPAASLHPFGNQAADAIAKAHSARVLLRDLKPGNVIVTGEGQVKVLDFGLAKQIQTPEPEEPTAIVAITEEGSVAGAALLPEQKSSCPSPVTLPFQTAPSADR